MNKMFNQITKNDMSKMSKDMLQIVCVLSQLNIQIEKDENNEFVYEYELRKVA